MNAQWRRMIQCDKFGNFDKHLKSGSTTALHEYVRVEGFPSWFGVVFEEGTMELSALSLSIQSRRLYMSSFLSTFWF
jgi:hypothetical protein